MSEITIGERLQELIKESGLEQQEVAALLGMNRSTFNGYVNNVREPKIDTLKYMAKYFKVSVDYLIGNSTERYSDLKHLSKELNAFVKNPENAAYIELAMDIKARTNTMASSQQPGK